MKKIMLALAFSLASATINAQQPWMNKLNNADDEDNAKFGTSNSVPVGFFTNNVKRMTLDVDGHLVIHSLSGSGRRFLQVDADGVLNTNTFMRSSAAGHVLLSTGSNFGIGVSEPAFALDVNGSGRFSNDIKVQGQLALNNSLKLSDYLGIRYVPASGGRIAATIFEALTPGITEPFTPAAPCNMFYVNTALLAPNTYDNSFQFRDLIQVYNPNGVLLNMGINNGNGIISAENGTAKLRLNPGCANDVYICEGGGYTKMFNSAGVVGDLAVTRVAKIGAAPYAGNAVIEANFTNTSGVTDAMRISNTSLSSGDKRIFNIGWYGETYIGNNLQANSAMLTIGQPTKANLALCLTDNGTVTNKNFFSVYGNGITEIVTTAANANDNIFSIKDYASSNINFTVKKNGFVYAREVIVTLNNFPDYVFSKDYHLPDLQHVKAFIQKNHRLPDMPSAGEVEQNGANLGEIQKITVKKVEELYLYILQLEEKIDGLNAKLETLQKSR